jgi:hypothetical protein
VAARLLWKEASQAWPWYLFGALAAVAAIPWMLPERMTGWQGQVRDYPWMLVTLAMSVRGAMLAAERGRQSYAAAHFSIHPERMPAFAFGVNLLGVLLLGLTAGWWFAVHRDPLLLAPIVYFFTVAFLHGYIIAAIFGKSYAGIIAGIPWLLLYYPLFADQLRTPSSSNFDLFYSLFDQILILGSSLACGLLAVVFLLLSRRLPPLVRRGGMAFFMVLGLGSSIIIQSLLWGGFSPHNDYYRIINQRLASSNGARVVEFVREEPPKPYYTVQFTDYREQREARQQVTMPYLLLGFDGPDSVLLVGQRRGEGRMQVARWSLAENRIEPLFSFRIRRGALRAGLRDSRVNIVSLHADARYAALQFPSLLGERAADLWLLDLRQQQALLVLVGEPAASLAWREKLLIVGSPYPRQVSLATGKVTSFHLNLQEVEP